MNWEDLKESGSGLFEILLRHSPGGYEKKHKKSQDGRLAADSRIEFLSNKSEGCHRYVNPFGGQLWY
jgi:hypothetical protein